MALKPAKKGLRCPSFSSKIPVGLKIAVVIIGLVSGFAALVVLAVEITQIKEAIRDLESTPPQFLVGDLKFSVGPLNAASWIICEGQQVSRTTYSSLFDILGVAFGQGDSNTTFNVPDFRGRLPGMVGAGLGLTPRSRGDQVGVEVVQLTINELPSHSHDLYGDTSGATADTTTADAYITGGMSLGFSESVGGDLPHANMQPTLFAGAFYIYAG